MHTAHGDAAATRRRRCGGPAAPMGARGHRDRRRTARLRGSLRRRRCPRRPADRLTDGRTARRRRAAGRGAPGRRQHRRLRVGMPSARLPESGPHAARRAGTRLVQQRRRAGPAGAGRGPSGAGPRPRRRPSSARQLQEQQLGALAGAWQGRGRRRFARVPSPARRSIRSRGLRGARCRRRAHRTCATICGMRSTRRSPPPWRSTTAARPSVPNGWPRRRRSRREPETVRWRAS